MFFKILCHQNVSTDADFTPIESKKMLFFGGILKFLKNIGPVEDSMSVGHVVT
jgi:hypothetical protein